MENVLKYKVGQEINIGYYGGFHNQKKLKAKAKVVAVSDRWIDIHVHLPYGGYRHMFGYDTDLEKLEDNYKQW